MSDVARVSTPLLHPVLNLRREPTMKEAPGGGKKESDVVQSRLERQRKVLLADVNEIQASGPKLHFFGGSILLVARMFEDSFAVSKTPRDLFRGGTEVLIRRPAPNGYLIEATILELRRLEARIKGGQSIGVRCDISRVRSLRPYGSKLLYRGRSVQELWDQAAPTAQGRAFHMWLAPFKSQEARSAILVRLRELQDSGRLLATSPMVSFGQRESLEVVTRKLTTRDSSLAVAERYYRAEGRGRAIISVPSVGALEIIIASGGTFRLDPVSEIEANSPGSGAEPPALPDTISFEPVVGIIDGGNTARRYAQAEAWREPAFIADRQADRSHGNQVTSLVVHGHEWNNNLPLPELYCRFGVAQAVPRKDAHPRPDPTGLASYIDGVIGRHPETKVWNLSWNEKFAADAIYVSALGHDLSQIARKHDVLLVISAGNVSGTVGDCIAPPADCEAALVVGGRQFDAGGKPKDRCPESLRGYGPELRLIPHVCGYSPLRLLGGEVRRGTSFPTGLISSLAAHTFHNLKNPSPDFVKALLIDQCDLSKYDQDLGWGTPVSNLLPWNCASGTVKLAFRRSLAAGYNYYWENIPIPRSLIRGGKICGRVSLTTIHRPLCVEEGGPSYISTRVGAAVQYPDHNGDFKRLVGAKEKETTAELRARSEEYKWQPMRRDSRDFTRGGGILCGGSVFRIYVRLFARNIEHFGHRGNVDIEPVDTVFVVTISDGSSSSQVYDSMVASLGNAVESAVLNQDIDIDF